MLLPGDCAYAQIPNVYSGVFTSLVASHHGGRSGTGAIPQFDKSPSGRLAYSFGPDNSYHHPFANVRNDHTNAEWCPALETASRCPERGARPAGNAFGHVHLYWDPADADAHPGCGGSPLPADVPPALTALFSAGRSYLTSGRPTVLVL